MRLLRLFYDASVLPPATLHWLWSEKKYVPVDPVSNHRSDVAFLLPSVDPASLRGRLVAVDDQGNAWLDASAELVVAWALRGYRGWALSIGHPSRLPFQRGNLNWLAGGSGVPWPEGASRGVCVAQA